MQNPPVTVAPDCAFRNIAKCVSFRILIDMKQNTRTQIMLYLVSITRALQKADEAGDLTPKEKQAYQLLRDAQWLILEEVEAQMLKDMGVPEIE